MSLKKTTSLMIMYLNCLSSCITYCMVMTAIEAETCNIVINCIVITVIEAETCNIIINCIVMTHRSRNL